MNMTIACTNIYKRWGGAHKASSARRESASGAFAKAGLFERLSTAPSDGRTSRTQVLQHLELRLGIGLERSVPVDVVGRDVEDDRHVGREVDGGGELVGGYLRHVDVRVAGSNRIQAHVADVADGCRSQPCLLEQVGGAGGGGGLPVRAGDGHPDAVGGALAPRELDLAYQLDAFRLAVHVELLPIRDARAGNAQVELLVEAIEGIVAERIVDAFARKGLDEFLGSGVARPSGYEHPVDARSQQVGAIAGNGFAGLAQAKDEHAAEILGRHLETVHHTTPSRLFAKYSEKPTAAHAVEISQKRMTTFVSDQPFFSK